MVRLPAELKRAQRLDPLPQREAVVERQQSRQIHDEPAELDDGIETGFLGGGQAGEAVGRDRQPDDQHERADAHLELEAPAVHRDEVAEIGGQVGHGARAPVRANVTSASIITRDVRVVAADTSFLLAQDFRLRRETCNRGVTAALTLPSPPFVQGDCL